VDEHPVVIDFSPRKKKYLSMIPSGGNWRALPEAVARESMGKAFFAKGGRSGWWRRLDWDAPCPTVTTMPNHASTSLCHPEEVRALSIAEAARIQEFPAGWIFCGTPQEQMKQIGNAVPTRLGMVAAEVVRHASQAVTTADSLLPRFNRTYVKSHVRTRRWWHDGRHVIAGSDDAIVAVG
jgi:DNA (cytosine-5)-methyltransferase 1